MSTNVAQVTQNSFLKNYSDKASKSSTVKEEMDNLFSQSFESITGKSIEEMQAETAQRNQDIKDAFANKELDKAFDLIGEDGLLGKMLDFGWDVGSAICNFFKGIFSKEGK